MEIKDLILPLDKLPNMTATPYYAFSISKTDQELFYFGSKHTRDPNDEILNQIEIAWTEMLKKYDSKNLVAVVESGVNLGFDSKERSVYAGGEGGFVNYLAEKSEVKVYCFEPDTKFLWDVLLTKFTKEQVFCYFVSQIIFQWYRYPKRPEFEKYLKYFLDKYETKTEWSGFDFSFNNYKSIFKSIFNKEFKLVGTEEEVNFLNDNLAPTNNISILNSISAEKNYYRETNIIEGILSKWNEGKSVFVVYGLGHAFVQEPALKKLLI